MVNDRSTRLCCNVLLRVEQTFTCADAFAWPGLPRVRLELLPVWVQTCDRTHAVVSYCRVRGQLAGPKLCDIVLVTRKCHFRVPWEDGYRPNASNLRTVKRSVAVGHPVFGGVQPQQPTRSKVKHSLSIILERKLLS
jgi:hypothetical protein